MDVNHPQLFGAGVIGNVENGTNLNHKLKRLSHLPIIADPSHATGKWGLVAPVGSAAVAAGVDGLIVEVHSDPEEALSDGTQSLLPGNFNSFMK